MALHRGNHLPSVLCTLQVTDVDFLKFFILQPTTNVDCLLKSIGSQLAFNLALYNLGHVIDCLTVPYEPNVDTTLLCFRW